MKQNKLQFIILCALAGISLIFSIICFTLPDGTNTPAKQYGGDAYTGIQNAAAATARNVLDLNKTVSTIAGLVFIMVALFVGYKAFCLFWTEKQEFKKTYDLEINN